MSSKFVNIDQDIEWSIRTWKQRHEKGYFPNSDKHKDWSVYLKPPEWLIQFGLPTEADDALEIGCGYGEWMIPLAPYVRSVYGIDIHETIIDKANQKFAELGTDNCFALLSNGLTIPFTEISEDDTGFSLIYSISVFQHIPKKMTRNYLAEAFRVASVGGRGLFHLRSSETIGNAPEPAEDIAANHTGDFSCGWSTQELLQAGVEAGWKNCRVEDLGMFLILIGTKP